MFRCQISSYHFHNFARLLLSPELRKKIVDICLEITGALLEFGMGAGGLFVEPKRVNFDL